MVLAGCCRPKEPHEVHLVRVGRDGLWWAEDDLGLVAGAATYDELTEKVWEWCEAEGVGCVAMVIVDGSSIVDGVHHGDPWRVDREVGERCARCGVRLDEPVDDDWIVDVVGNYPEHGYCARCKCR